jgi:hypothetical protein
MNGSAVNNKIKRIRHDRFILENLLVSFKIAGATEMSKNICAEHSDIDTLNSYDFENYGEEKYKIKIAVKAYIKALNYINNYYET